MARIYLRDGKDLANAMRGLYPIQESTDVVSEDSTAMIDEWSGGRSYPRDPFWLTAKYAGVDVDGKPFKKGEKVFYYPNNRTFLTGAKAEKASREFEAARQDEVMYNEGVEVEKEKDEQVEEKIEEATSDSRLAKLVDAMVYSPRVETILTSIGLDETSMETFKNNLMPAIKLTLDKMGLGVTGAATAKRDVRTMAR